MTSDQPDNPESVSRETSGDADQPAKPKRRVRKPWALRRPWPLKNPDNPAHNQFTPKDQLIFKGPDAPRLCTVPGCGKPAQPARVQPLCRCRAHRNEYAREWQRKRAAARRARRFEEFRRLPWLTGNEKTPEEVVRTLTAGGCVVRWNGEERKWSINGILITNKRLMLACRKAPQLQRQHGWWERKKK